MGAAYTGDERKYLIAIDKFKKEKDIPKFFKRSRGLKISNRFKEVHTIVGKKLIGRAP